MERCWDIRVNLLSLVHEAAAPPDIGGGTFVARALAHDERGRDTRRLEIFFQLRNPVAGRLQRHRDSSIEGREILALLIGSIAGSDGKYGPKFGRDFDDSLRRGARRDREAEPAERLTDGCSLVFQRTVSPDAACSG